MQIVCPLDGKDDAIRKVSGISSTNTAYNLVHDEYGNQFTAIRPQIASLIQRPTKPAHRWFYGWGKFANLFGCLMFSALVCGTFWLLGLGVRELIAAEIPKWATAPMPFAIGIMFALPVFLFGLLGYYSAVWGDKRDDKRYDEEYKIWQNAMEKWDRLYYCYRHDIFFDSDTKEVIKPDRIKNYIYGE